MKLDNHFVEEYKLNKMLNINLRLVRNKDVKPNTKGAHSFCYYFGNYVILRNITKFYKQPETLEKLENIFIKKKEFVNNLKKEFHINTPELCCCYKGNHHFYEIQERAKGNVLSVFYPSTARAITFKTDKVMDTNNTQQELIQEESVQGYEAAEIGQGMYLYNINMQKQLKTCDQQLFDRFVKDFKNLEKHGISIDTSRSENFLFDKTEGFSFIDLDLKQPNDSVSSDFLIGRLIFESFGDFKTYCQFMTAPQIKTILTNADTIRQRLYKAMKNNHFALSPAEDEALKLRTCMAKTETEKLISGRRSSSR